MKSTTLFARLILFLVALIVAVGFLGGCGSTRPESIPVAVMQSDLVGVRTTPQRKLDSLARVYPEIAPYIAPAPMPAPKRSGLFGWTNTGKYKDQRSYNIVIDSNNKDKSKSKASGAAVIAAEVDSGAIVNTSNSLNKQGKGSVATSVDGDGNTTTATNKNSKPLPVGWIVFGVALVGGLGYFAIKIWQKKRTLIQLQNPLV